MYMISSQPLLMPVRRYSTYSEPRGCILCNGYDLVPLCRRSKIASSAPQPPAEGLKDPVYMCVHTYNTYVGLGDAGS